MSGTGALAAPVDAEGRLHALDVLRGLALFGMILVHFHQKMRVDVTGLEDLIGWAVYILIEQKAWGTFAFLFGAGFAILLRRLEARGRPVAAIYVRRLVALAAFGVIAEVGFGFHILFTYALWGLPLLAVRRWSVRALLVLALLAVVARPVTSVLTSAGLPPPGARPGLAELRQAADARAAEGGYRDLLEARWRLFAATTPVGWRSFLPDVNFALFLLGLLAVRGGVLDRPGHHRRVIAAGMAFGFFSWSLAWLGWPYLWGLGVIEDQWLCLTYIGGMLLVLDRWPAWLSRLRAFAWTGRMALTNYFIQAMTLDALASGYGVHLRLRPALYVVAAVTLFGLEAAASAAWLRRFRFGPLEWVWRVVTYGRPVFS